MDSTEHLHCVRCGKEMDFGEPYCLDPRLWCMSCWAMEPTTNRPPLARPYAATSKPVGEAQEDALVRKLRAMMLTATEGDAYILHEAIAALAAEPLPMSRPVMPPARLMPPKNTAAGWATQAERRERTTPRRQAAVGLLLDKGYSWQDGRWVEPVPLRSKLGAAGMLHRGVYTYTGRQPDNLDAWRIGEACSAAANASAGDPIDRGLVLLRELEAKGFAVQVTRDAP